LPELASNLLVVSTMNSTVAKVGGTQVSTCTGPSSGGTAQTATHTKRGRTVTEGRCTRSKLSGSGVDSIPAGGCHKTALSNVTFKQLTALVVT